MLDVCRPYPRLVNSGWLVMNHPCSLNGTIFYSIVSLRRPADKIEWNWYHLLTVFSSRVTVALCWGHRRVPCGAAHGGPVHQSGI